MQIRELTVPDAFEVIPQQLEDNRGSFLEWYRFDKLADVIGHPLQLRQANMSVSKRGVVRGIHFADFPLGQAKYVTAVHGAVLDFVVDIRIGSPSFGTWDTVLLDTLDRRAIYIAEGLGHAFVALTDDATVSYLVSDTYNPSAEHAINPLDPQLGLVFPTEAGEPIISSKDRDAPTLSQAQEQDLLPEYEAARAYYESLNAAVTS